MPYTYNLYCSHMTEDDKIASVLYDEYRLKRIKEMKYDPYISGNPLLMFIPYSMLPFEMRNEFKRKHNIILSFEDFIKDYIEHPIYYKLLRAMEEKKK